MNIDVPPTTSPPALNDWFFEKQHISCVNMKYWLGMV